MTNTDPLDLLARAANVIDGLDDIDEIASIGGPMDDLSNVLGEIAAVAAIRETTRDVPAERVHDMLRQDSSPEWRVQWLVRHTGCTSAAAQLIAATSPERFASLAESRDLVRLQSVMESAAVAVADDLRERLGDRVGSIVPDTIPADWS